MMKNIFSKISGVLLLASFLLSCTSSLDEENGYKGGLNPVDKTLQISSNSSTYKVGDLVRFEIKGTADSIIVYTGDEGHNYTYKDGQKVDIKYYINFDSNCRSTTSDVNPVYQKNQMSLLLSKNFDGVLAYNNIKTADWVDFNSSVYWPVPIATDYVNSGNCYVESILDPEANATTMYIAILQTTLNQDVNGFGNLNRVRNLTLKSTYGAGDAIVLEHQNMGWTIISSPNKQPDRAALESTTVIQLRNNWWRSNSSGNTTGIDYFLEDTEDWVVSKAITLPRQKELGASEYVVVKSDPSEGKVGNYTYKYTNPGEYEVVFVVVFNKNKTDEREEIIKIPVTITE